MKKMLVPAVLLAVCLLTSALAEKPDAFSFRNGITWDSTFLEVQFAEGSAGEIESLKETTILSYTDAAVLNLTADLLYCFVGEQLISACYTLSEKPETDADHGIYRALLRALDVKYGDHDPIQWIAFAACLDGIWEIDQADKSYMSLSERVTGVQWSLGDGTEIKLFSIKNRTLPDAVCVFYLNGDYAGININGL